MPERNSITLRICGGLLTHNFESGLAISGVPLITVALRYQDSALPGFTGMTMYPPKIPSDGIYIYICINIEGPPKTDPLGTILLPGYNQKPLPTEKKKQKHAPEVREVCVQATHISETPEFLGATTPWNRDPHAQVPNFQPEGLVFCNDPSAKSV